MRRGWWPAQVTLQPDGRLRVDFRLWDVYGESQMVGTSFLHPAGKLAPRRPYGLGRHL